MAARFIAALMTGFLAAGGSSLAHHSFAMFDQGNPIELFGEVREFKFTSPHSFILLQVRDGSGSVTTWSLEGISPSALVREGWSSKTLKHGDAVRLTIWPLRSGAPGGAWTTDKIKFQDGRPIVVEH